MVAWTVEAEHQLLLLSLKQAPKIVIDPDQIIAEWEGADPPTIRSVRDRFNMLRRKSGENGLTVASSGASTPALGSGSAKAKAKRKTPLTSNIVTPSKRGLSDTFGNSKMDGHNTSGAGVATKDTIVDDDITSPLTPTPTIETKKPRRRSYNRRPPGSSTTFIDMDPAHFPAPPDSSPTPTGEEVVKREIKESEPAIISEGVKGFIAATPGSIGEGSVKKAGVSTPSKSKSRLKGNAHGEVNGNGKGKINGKNNARNSTVTNSITNSNDNSIFGSGSGSGSGSGRGIGSSNKKRKVSHLFSSTSSSSSEAMDSDTNLNSGSGSDAESESESESDISGDGIPTPSQSRSHINGNTSKSIKGSSNSDGKGNGTADGNASSINSDFPVLSTATAITNAMTNATTNAPPAVMPAATPRKSLPRWSKSSTPAGAYTNADSDEKFQVLGDMNGVDVGVGVSVDEGHGFGDVNRDGEAEDDDYAFDPDDEMDLDFDFDADFGIDMAVDDEVDVEDHEWFSESGSGMERRVRASGDIWRVEGVNGKGKSANGKKGWRERVSKLNI